MIKEFVPYEQSLALKELGFDEPCIGWMRDWAKDVCLGKHESSHHHESSCNAILYQQAFEFFREKYGYDVTIKKCTPSEYKFEIEQLFAEGDNHYFIDFPFKSHKEAELKCLDKLIETVKRKQ